MYKNSATNNKPGSLAAIYKYLIITALALNLQSCVLILNEGCPKSKEKKCSKTDNKEYKKETSQKSMTLLPAKS